MNISENVIIDLLPLYYSDEVSEDSRELIERYLNDNPEFANKFDQSKHNLFTQSIAPLVTPENDMIVLFKTKRFLKIRSWVFFLAIIFSAIPFAFGDVSWTQIEGVHWLWIEKPVVAITLAFLGVCFWIVYFKLNKRLNSVNL